MILSGPGDGLKWQLVLSSDNDFRTAEKNSQMLNPN